MFIVLLVVTFAIALFMSLLVVRIFRKSITTILPVGIPVVELQIIVYFSQGFVPYVFTSTPDYSVTSEDITEL